jgi:hypothetical protein
MKQTMTKTWGNRCRYAPLLCVLAMQASLHMQLGTPCAIPCAHSHGPPAQTTTSGDWSGKLLNQPCIVHQIQRSAWNNCVSAPCCPPPCTTHCRQVCGQERDFACIAHALLYAPLGHQDVHRAQDVSCVSPVVVPARGKTSTCTCFHMEQTSCLRLMCCPCRLCPCKVVVALLRPPSCSSY